MTSVSWAELRTVLSELVTREPSPLSSYPDPRAAEQHVPAHIRLTPWAVDVAQQLHERFGNEVVLTVGALAYPPGQGNDTEHETDRPRDPLLDPVDVEIVACEPLVVRTGEALRTEIRVTNHRSSPVSISTNGTIFGRVLDPSTGEVVGGYSGVVTAMLRVFTIQPGASEAIPLVVGTASYKKALGYAVPSGEWFVEVVLRLADGDNRVVPLPLRIIER